MPEPITTAARNALPSNSASSRRPSTTSLIAETGLTHLAGRAPARNAHIYRVAPSMNVNASKRSLSAWIDGRQDRAMSIQTGRRALDLIPAGSRAIAETYYIPLAREPIDEAAAARLAQMFKALADPVRLRLVSLIGAHQGGEVCVCELTEAFELT